MYIKRDRKKERERNQGTRNCRDKNVFLILKKEKPRYSQSSAPRFDKL